MPDENVKKSAPTSSVDCTYIDNSDHDLRHVTVWSWGEPKPVRLSQHNKTHSFTVPDPEGTGCETEPNSCPKESGLHITSLTRPMKAVCVTSEEAFRSGVQFTLFTCGKFEAVTLRNPGEYHCFYPDGDDPKE
jgi:hypothetical protein